MTQTISRRNLTQTAAWTIPVVVLGAAAPATAASCIPDNRNVTLQASNNTVGNNTFISFTNTSHDTAPAGTTLTFQINATITSQELATGSYTISLYPSNDEGYSWSVDNNPMVLNVPTTKGSYTATVTLTEPLAPNNNINLTWSTTSHYSATVRAKNVTNNAQMHPDGFGGGSSTQVSTNSIVPATQNTTQSTVDDNGCPITMNVTVPAFNS